MENTRYFEDVIDNIKYKKPFAAGQNSAAYYVSKESYNQPRLDYVLLKSHKQLDSSIRKYILSDLQQQQETISKLRERHNINTPRLVYYTQKAGTLYQIQERANGRPLGFMSATNYLSYIKQNDYEKLIEIIQTSEEGEFNTKFTTYTDEHGNTLKKSTPLIDAIISYNNDNLKALLTCDDSIFTKYLEDYKTLFINYGFRIDNHAENFVFDEQKGISFIDLNVSSDNKSGYYLKSLETQYPNLDRNSTNSALIPINSSAELDITCLKQAVNETFDLGYIRSEETKILTSLLIKKACRCAKSSPMFSEVASNGMLDEYLEKSLSDRRYYCPDEEIKDFIDVAKSNNSHDKVIGFQTKYSAFEGFMDFNRMDTSFILDFLEQNPEFNPSEPNPSKSSPFSKVSSTFNSIINHIKNAQFKQQELPINNNKTAPIEEDFEDYRTRILEDSNFEFDPNDDYSL